MRLAEGVEWGLHACVLLAVLPESVTLPASRLAEYHGVPAAYMAKNLQALSRAGIVESLPGQKGGYRLARSAADITLLDVVEAIDGVEPSFRCSEIRRRGPAAVPAREYKAVCTIAKAMWQADERWRAELRSQTVGDLVSGLSRAVSPKAVAKTATWFQEVLP
jgi:Rrf2 family protein